MQWEQQFLIYATEISVQSNGFWIKKYPLCLGNIWKDFTANNMKIQKAGLNGYVYEFSVHYNIIDASNVINIHKYLMKKHDIKLCLELLKNCLLYY